MKTPLQITFRDMDGSTALEEEIHKRAAHLEAYFDHIIRCRVVVAAPSQHHRQGQEYQVRIELSVPGTELVAGDRGGNEDVYLAVRESFSTAERELKKYVERRLEAQQSRRVTQ
jgi:ribosomal subunit interface protein